MNTDFLAELLSKLQAAFSQGQQPEAPPNSKHKVELDLHLQGSVTTTETEAEVEKAPRGKA